MFRVQFDPCDAAQDSVSATTFEEAWQVVVARFPQAHRQKWWDLVGSTSAPTWEGATLKIWPDRAACNKEYVQHQAPGAVEPDCLGGFAVAVIVSLSEHSPEPRAKLKLQGARCRLPGSNRSVIPATATLAQGWLGCHINTSFDAGAFQHKWRARPVSVAVPSAGQRTENLACPNCGRTVRVATVSRGWTVVVGLRGLSLVIVITLSSIMIAMIFHVLAGLPLWAVFAVPAIVFALFTSVSLGRS